MNIVMNIIVMNGIMQSFLTLDCKKTFDVPCSLLFIAL